MRRTFSSLLAVAAMGVFSFGAFAQSNPPAGASPESASSPRPDTGSLHTTVPQEPRKGSPKAQCMNEAKAAYQREQAVDDSVTRRSSQGQNTGAQR
ncbi:MAG: hypothetical protein E6H66_11865 [Betaproteobacteria bacterium]|nr:MAG: hypothetical protein E6H66_11865 [Betaproteobacteria bacterium]